jgi:hypothetical protein
MDIDNNGDIPDIVKAACVMHNIALLTDDNIYDFLDAELDEEINERTVVLFIKFFSYTCSVMEMFLCHKCHRFSMI